jgi:hypothetical protein
LPKVLPVLVQTHLRLMAVVVVEMGLLQQRAVMVDRGVAAAFLHLAQHQEAQEIHHQQRLPKVLAVVVADD